MRSLVIISVFVLFSVRLDAQVFSFRPLAMEEPVVTSKNVNWNYNMGYRFKVTANGNITHIGGKWRSGIKHKVRLFKYPSGIAIDSFDVTGTGNWNYLDISDIQVYEDSQYVVCVRLNAKNSGYYSNSMNFPVEHGGILIEGSTIIDSTDAMPTNLQLDRIYGFADITFSPCSCAGSVTTDNNKLIKGESTTMEVKEVTGPIQWLVSTDNQNYSDLVGEIYGNYNTGPAYETKYYKTINTSGSCLDTSEVLKISIVDPMYPLGVLNPRVSNTNVNWNYNMGYRFTCDIPGYVTELGGRWRDGVGHVVRLYDDSSGAILGSTMVTGAMEWNYEPINPIYLKKGKKYVVAVRLDQQYSGTYCVMDMPVSSGGITINEGTYRSNSNLKPTNSIGRVNYGNADLRFEPCVFAGYLQAEQNSVPIYDSTHIIVIEKNGSLIWQKSTDSVNFTTISGQTDTILNTGAILEDTWFRTVASDACGKDTSVPILITRYYAGFVMQSINPKTVITNVNWNYNMGYRFTPLVDGVVTQVGGNWSSGVTHKVHLFDYPSGNPIDSFSVTGTGDWHYDTITPISLTAGQRYVVTVRLNAQRSGKYGRTQFPITKGNILVHGGTYIDSTSAMPTNLITYYAYGYADLKFEACVYAGDIYCEDTLVCSGTSVNLEVKDTEGTIQWQSSSDNINFSNISGAIDTVLTATVNSTIYYRIVSSNVCGNDTSESFKIRVPGNGGKPGKWIGFVDDDWFKQCNWDDGKVPSAGDSVFIVGTAISPRNTPTISLEYLEIDCKQGLFINNNLTITGKLKLTNGGLTVSVGALIIEDTTVVESNYSLSYVQLLPGANYIINVDTAYGQFFAPIGSFGAYSPVDLFMISGSTGTSPQLLFSTYDSPHPLKGSPANYIERYWSFSGLNISLPSYFIELIYDQNDVKGSEANTFGQFNDGLNWTRLSAVNKSSNKAQNTSLLTDFGDFTVFGKESILSAQSGNWATGSTWVGSTVPTTDDNAIIRNGHTVQLTQSTIAGGIDVESGGVFNTQSNDLQFEGDLRSVGTLSMPGTVTMTSSDKQQIDIQGKLVLDTLIINNTNGVEIVSGNIDIKGKLDINAGSFYTNDALRLLSDSSWTAYITEVKGSLIGKIKAQRNIPETFSKIGYRHLSSPLKNTSLKDFMYNASTYPKGIYFYGIGGSNLANYYWPNAYSFNENFAGIGTFDDGWVPASHVNNPVGYQTPYTIYTGGVNFPSYDLEIEGYPNVGNKVLKDLSFTNSMGWQFIGNPYPSAIDWSKVSKNNVDANAYVFSESNSGYTATSLLSPAHQIASFQGFFVKVSSASNSITFEESDKVDNSPDFRKGIEQNARLRMELRNLDNSLKSIAAIDWIQGASIEYDNQFDAYKLSNPSPLPNLALMFDGQQDAFQINSVPANITSVKTELYCQTSLPGNFELHFELPESDKSCWILHDNLLDSIIDIRLIQSYRFWLDSSDQRGRFELVVHNFKESISSEPSSCYGLPDASLQLNLDSSLTYSYLLFDSTGSLLAMDSNKRGLERIDGLSAGNYSILLKQEELTCANNFFNVELFQPQKIEASFSQGSTAQVNDEISFQNTSRGTSKFIWDFGDGNTSFEIHPKHRYQEKGQYKVSLIAGEAACSDSSSAALNIEQALGIDEISLNEIKAMYNGGYLKIISAQNGIKAIKLTDIKGAEIIHIQYPESTKELLEQINLSSGIYMLQVEADGMNSNLKLTVQ